MLKRFKKLGFKKKPETLNSYYRNLMRNRFSKKDLAVMIAIFMLLQIFSPFSNLIKAAETLNPPLNVGLQNGNGQILLKWINPYTNPTFSGVSVIYQILPAGQNNCAGSYYTPSEPLFAGVNPTNRLDFPGPLTQTNFHIFSVPNDRTACFTVLSYDNNSPQNWSMPINLSGTAHELGGRWFTISASPAPGQEGYSGRGVIEYDGFINSVRGVGPFTSAVAMNQGESLTLTAVPYPGFHFVRWEDYGGGAPLCVGGPNPCTINGIAADGTAVAFFEPDVPVTSITVSGSNSVAAGSNTTLSTTIAPSNATNQTVSWSSSNTGVATVNSTGVVTGVSPGTATITATANDGSGVTGTIVMTVTAAPSSIPVTSITLLEGVSIAIGVSIELLVDIAPANATNRTLSWTSSNTSVATVNSAGSVTGVSAGTATITATANDGSGVTQSALITVMPSTSIPVTNITVSGSNSVAAGSNTTLSTTIAPTNATNQTVSWSSSNTAVATVNSAGSVTGVSAGTATITATANDGSGVTGTILMTVTAASGGTGPVAQITNSLAQTGPEIANLALNLLIALFAQILIMAQLRKRGLVS